MRVKRQEKDDDQENGNKAHNLMVELIELNPQIDGDIWLACFWAVIMASFKNSGFTYKETCEEVDQVKKHYKSLWSIDVD